MQTNVARLLVGLGAVFAGLKIGERVTGTTGSEGQDPTPDPAPAADPTPARDVEDAALRAGSAARERIGSQPDPASPSTPSGGSVPSEPAPSGTSGTVAGSIPGEAGTIEPSEGDPK